MIFSLVTFQSVSRFNSSCSSETTLAAFINYKFRFRSSKIPKTKRVNTVEKYEITTRKNRKITKKYDLRRDMPAHEQHNPFFSGKSRALHRSENVQKRTETVTKRDTGASVHHGGPSNPEEAYDQKRLQDAIRKIVERSPVGPLEAKPTPCRRVYSEPYSTTPQPSAFNRRKNKKGLSLTF